MHYQKISNAQFVQDKYRRDDRSNRNDQDSRMDVVHPRILIISVTAIIPSVFILHKLDVLGWQEMGSAADIYAHGVFLT